MAMLKLSSPWIILYHKIEEMFARDSFVSRVVFEEESDSKKLIKIYVADNDEKAAALHILMKQLYTFDNVEVYVKVIPTNGDTLDEVYGYRVASSTEELFRAALIGNFAFNYVEKVVGVFSNPIYYVVFDKEVAQYYTDNIGDANGICSTLYQELAKELFISIDGVFYCTDTSRKSTTSLRSVISSNRFPKPY